MASIIVKSKTQSYKLCRVSERANLSLISDNSLPSSTFTKIGSIHCESQVNERDRRSRVSRRTKSSLISDHRWHSSQPFSLSHHHTDHCFFSFPCLSTDHHSLDGDVSLQPRQDIRAASPPLHRRDIHCATLGTHLRYTRHDRTQGLLG